MEFTGLNLNLIIQKNSLFMDDGLKTRDIKNT